MQQGISSKQRVKILTVDAASRRVEAILKDGTAIQVAVWEVPILFRWPKEEEWWTVVKQNGYWMLDALIEQPSDDVQVTDLDAGQARIAADNVLLSSGQQLASYADDPAEGNILVWRATAGAWVLTNAATARTALGVDPAMTRASASFTDGASAPQLTWAPTSQGKWILALYYNDAAINFADVVVGISTGDGVTKIPRIFTQGHTASHAPWQNNAVFAASGASVTVTLPDGSTGETIQFRAKLLGLGDQNST
jgi:hypothetical protein